MEPSYDDLDRPHHPRCPVDPCLCDELAEGDWLDAGEAAYERWRDE